MADVYLLQLILMRNRTQHNYIILKKGAPRPHFYRMLFSRGKITWKIMSFSKF